MKGMSPFHSLPLSVHAAVTLRLDLGPSRAVCDGCARKNLFGNRSLPLYAKISQCRVLAAIQKETPEWVIKFQLYETYTGHGIENNGYSKRDIKNTRRLS